MSQQTKENEICIEMLMQRGYSIEENTDEIIIAFNSKGKKILCFFVKSPKFTTAYLTAYITIMNEKEISHSIIVYKEGVTPATKKTIDQLEEKHIELFAEEDLQYNITKHVLQPKFHCLTPQQSNAFKKQYGTKFATMKYDDPIARFYDYQKGSVIRITRKNGYITHSIVK